MGQRWPLLPHPLHSSDPSLPQRQPSVAMDARSLPLLYMPSVGEPTGRPKQQEAAKHSKQAHSISLPHYYLVLHSSSNGAHRDGLVRHRRRSVPGSQVHRHPPRRPPFHHQLRQSQQRRQDPVHAGVAGVREQEVRDAVVPAAADGGAAAEAGGLPAAQQLGALPRVQQGRLRVPRELHLPVLLRRPLLDHVEAAHVRLHRRVAGLQGAAGGHRLLPGRLRPDPRLRQHQADAVRQLHRLQARGQRVIKLLASSCVS